MAPGQISVYSHDLNYENPSKCLNRAHPNVCNDPNSTLKHYFSSYCCRVAVFLCYPACVTCTQFELMSAFHLPLLRAERVKTRK